MKTVYQGYHFRDEIKTILGSNTYDLYFSCESKDFSISRSIGGPASPAVFELYPDQTLHMPSGVYSLEIRDRNGGLIYVEDEYAQVKTTGYAIYVKHHEYASGFVGSWGG